MYYFVHFLANCDIDQSRSPQSEKFAQKDSSRHSTTSGRKDTKYKLLYVSKRRGGGGGLHAQDSSSTSDGLNNLNGSTTSGKCVLSTKSCPPTQSTTTTQNNGGSSAPPSKQNKNADEFQFRSAQQSVEQREVISNSNSKVVGKGSRQQRRKIITLNGFSKKAQMNLQFPNSNNGAESIL